MNEEIETFTETYELVSLQGEVLKTGLTYEEYAKEMMDKYGVDVKETETEIPAKKDK